jgi:GMP synthase-like glutamine amidotransferase
MNTIGIIQHHPAEGVGRIANWAAQRGITLDVRHAQALFADEYEYDTCNDWQALIVLGGPWNLNAAPDWLQRESTAIRHWLAAGKPTLGICLGAQILAQQLGAVVTPMASAERGWVDVELVDAKLVDAASHYLLKVPQWHEQTFSLPPGAQSIGRSSACACQGFRVDKHWGVQFHPEWDAQAIAALKQGFGEDLPTSLEVEDAATTQLQQALNNWFFARLDQWWAMRLT